MKFVCVKAVAKAGQAYNYASNNALKHPK